MKNLRNIVLSVLLTLGAFSAATVLSCNTDKCKNTVCDQGAACSDGVCSCPVGFTGTTCQTEDPDSRVKFARNWNGQWVNTANTSSTGAYNSTISLDANSFVIDISNFSGLFVHPVYATVNGYNLTIATQTPDGSAGYSVAGIGTYYNGTITFSYTIVGSTSTKNFTDTFN